MLFGRAIDVFVAGVAAIAFLVALSLIFRELVLWYLRGLVD